MELLLAGVIKGVTATSEVLTAAALARPRSMRARARSNKQRCWLAQNAFPRTLIQDRRATGPSRCRKVPGLQRTVPLRSTLRCARDTREGARRQDTRAVRLLAD
jgi:hypothetical protein